MFSTGCGAIADNCQPKMQITAQYQYVLLEMTLLVKMEIVDWWTEQNTSNLPSTQLQVVSKVSIYLKFNVSNTNPSLSFLVKWRCPLLT